MKQARTRLYVVGHGTHARLIRADHPATALRFATKDVVVRVASQEDLVQLVQAGVKPELAKPENGELAV